MANTTTAPDASAPMDFIQLVGSRLEQTLAEAKELREIVNGLDSKIKGEISSMGRRPKHTDDELTLMIADMEFNQS